MKRAADLRFAKEKKEFLEKKDKSRKKSIDAGIMPLIDAINAMPNYFTTSSCAGRILLIEKGSSDKKRDARWLLSSHSQVSLKEIKDALAQQDSQDVFLKQESFILHVCCKGLDDADKLLHLTNSGGIRRSGIISLGRKIIVEIIGSEQLEAIVSKKGRIAASDKYLKILLSEANMRLKKNNNKIKKINELLLSGKELKQHKDCQQYQHDVAKHQQPNVESCC